MLVSDHRAGRDEGHRAEEEDRDGARGRRHYVYIYIYIYNLYIYIFLYSLLTNSRSQVIAVARTCSCLIIVLDAMKDIAQKKKIETELEGVGIRLNKLPPDIKVEKKVGGGINFASTVRLSHLDEDSIKVRSS